MAIAENRGSYAGTRERRRIKLIYQTALWPSISAVCARARRLIGTRASDETALTGESGFCIIAGGLGSQEP